MAVRMRQRLVAAAYLTGWALVRRLPESWMAWLFARIADVAWWRRGRGVQRLEANLARVVGSASPERIRRLSRAGMRSYLRYWLEVFRLPAMSRARIVERMHITGGERIWDTLDSGRGVILALPHMGNWDHAGAWVVANGRRFTTVAERLEPVALYEAFVAFRERLGMEVLAVGDGNAFATLAQRLRAGGLVCLVADRDLSESGVEVEFFGEPARVPAGPAALAVRTGAALLPVALWYEDDAWGAYVYEEIPVPPAGSREERTREMTQRLVEVFEEAIAKHPEDWHMLQRVFVADLGRPRDRRGPT